MKRAKKKERVGGEGARGEIYCFTRVYKISEASRVPTSLLARPDSGRDPSDRRGLSRVLSFRFQQKSWVPSKSPKLTFGTWAGERACVVCVDRRLERA